MLLRNQRGGHFCWDTVQLCYFLYRQLVLSCLITHESFICKHAVYWNSVLSGPLPNDDNFFIVADYHLGNIYQIDATTGVTGQLLPLGVRRLTSTLTYDPTTKLIYWAEIRTRTINRYSLLTNISTVIYRDPSRAGKVRLLTVTYSLSHPVWAREQ